jgi:hypothetical protein
MSLDSNNRCAVLPELNAFKALDELAAEEIRLAGLRIDPATYGESRKNFIATSRYYNLRRE